MGIQRCGTQHGFEVGLVIPESFLEVRKGMLAVAGGVEEGRFFSQKVRKSLQRAGGCTLELQDVQSFWGIRSGDRCERSESASDGGPFHLGASVWIFLFISLDLILKGVQQ